MELRKKSKRRVVVGKNVRSLLGKLIETFIPMEFYYKDLF